MRTENIITATSAEISPAANKARGLAVSVAILVAIGIVLALAALHVLKPFEGDQASFLLGAQTLNGNGRLYVDYWDIKQPGIFFFYWASAHFLGFNAWGVHLGELVYWAAVSVALTALLRPFLYEKRLAIFAPFLFLSTYLGGTSAWHATQVEALVGGPLIVCILLVANGLTRPDRANVYYILAGAACGLALWFKLAFAPVFMPVFATIWLHMFFAQTQRRFMPYIWSALFVFLGVALVAAPGLVWFAARGNLTQLYETSFYYPLELLQTGIAQREVDIVGRFVQSLFFAVRLLFPFLVLLVLGLPALIKNWAIVPLLCLVAVLGAGIVVLMQAFSLWEYHFQIFFMPIIVTAIIALDLLVVRHGSDNKFFTGRLPTSIFIVLIIMTAQVGQANWHAGINFVKSVMRDNETVNAFYAKTYPKQARIQEIAKQSGLSEPDAEIYVFGNPKIYHALDARQAISVLGWSWEIAAPTLFERAATELKAAMPVRIYMTRKNAGIIAKQDPALNNWLTQAYQVVFHDNAGTWLAPR